MNNYVENHLETAAKALNLTGDPVEATIAANGINAMILRFVEMEGEEPPTREEIIEFYNRRAAEIRNDLRALARHFASVVDTGSELAVFNGADSHLKRFNFVRRQYRNFLSLRVAFTDMR